MDVIWNFGVLQFRELLRADLLREKRKKRKRSWILISIFTHFLLIYVNIRRIHFILITTVIVLLCTGLSIAQTTLLKFDPGLIHHGDVIDVDVIGSFEFDWRGGITPEGFLDGYDKIADQIPAICHSETEVAASIEAALKAVLREPKVVVRIIDRSNRPLAAISGAVRNPYRFRIKRDVRVNELIALSGGITDNASGTIDIFRPRNAGCVEKSQESNAGERVNIQISDLLAGKTEANPIIAAGDIINVLEANPVYVIGGISNPGQIKFRPGLTLDRAIAISGGVVKRNGTGKVKIYRRTGGKSEIIEAEVPGNTVAAATEMPLQPFDIVEILERGSAERRFPVMASRSDTNNDAAIPIRTID
jgi:protein involved in polysaccharide export with SLBB domain